MACDMARQDKIDSNAVRDIPGVTAAVAWTATDLRKLPPGLQKILSQPSSLDMPWGCASPRVRASLVACIGYFSSLTDAKPIKNISPGFVASGTLPLARNSWFHRVTKNLIANSSVVGLIGKSLSTNGLMGFVGDTLCYWGTKRNSIANMTHHSHHLAGDKGRVRLTFLRTTPLPHRSGSNFRQKDSKALGRRSRLRVIWGRQREAELSAISRQLLAKTPTPRNNSIARAVFLLKVPLGLKRDNERVPTKRSDFAPFALC